jgi:hypothetical protein
MKSQLLECKARTTLPALLLLALMCASPVAQTQQVLASDHAPEKQKGFSSPQLAAQELIKAAEKYDVTELLVILGPSGKDFIASADPVRDKDVAQQFVARAHEKNSVSVSKTKATLLVGNDHWPMPIPIVLKGGEWYFDTEAGRKEILFRRIGANELDAIRICRGFVEAQQEYASTIHDGSTIHQYARNIISSPGRQDGLFWNNPDSSAGGPISLPVARAIEEGYSATSPSPYHGYFFKVLKGQGTNAPWENSTMRFREP